MAKAKYSFEANIVFQLQYLYNHAFNFITVSELASPTNLVTTNTE